MELPAGADPVAVAALGLSAVAAHMALTWRGGLAARRAGARARCRAAWSGRRPFSSPAPRVPAGWSPARGRKLRRTGRRRRGPTPSWRWTPTTSTSSPARFAAAVDGPADLVLDPLYGVPAAAAARALRPGGRLVNLGSSAGETCPIDSSTLRSRLLSILGYTNNELTREQRAAAVTTVAEHVARGTLAVAHEIVPLADAPSAWQRQTEGRTSGRIVLRP